MDTELMGRIEAYVDEVWEDVVADISGLVSHPSIADSSAATAGAPFGEHVRGALDCALSIAERLAIRLARTRVTLALPMCLVRAGSRSPPSPMLTWSPPVPAGDRPVQDGASRGWLLGRGVIDDKGPAVLSLYAGAFLLRENIKPRYTYRALLGLRRGSGHDRRAPLPGAP